MGGKRFFLIGLICAVAATAAFLLTQRGEGEELTSDRLAKALARWAEKGPQDYDLRVVVSGVQRGDHRIEVRGGQVTKMTTDGVPASPSAHAYWTVEGMFRFLETEIENAGRAGAAYGAGEGQEVVLSADFDEAYGYPARFLRHVVGAQSSIEWQVASFQPAR